MFSALVFVSCGSDDEPSLQFDKNAIIGTWEITEVQGSPEWWWILTGTMLTFNSNGTCSTGFSMEDSYKIEGGLVKTYYAETQEPMYVYELMGRNGNTLTVKMKGTLDESNLSTVFKMTKK
ncbi:MAG: hypothetical protein IKW97_09905 [Muribaculaceae bacterium]|nr:hypothetical protein [Muribaculaceae bacterium]